MDVCLLAASNLNFTFGMMPREIRSVWRCSLARSATRLRPSSKYVLGNLIPEILARGVSLAILLQLGEALHDSFQQFIGIPDEAGIPLVGKSEHSPGMGGRQFFLRVIALACDSTWLRPIGATCSGWIRWQKGSPVFHARKDVGALHRAIARSFPQGNEMGTGAPVVLFMRIVLDKPAI